MIVQPSGQTALIAGDNTIAPPIEFVENPDKIRPGDRVMTSGDGGVFPAGLLIGQVAQDPSGRTRLRLAADYERLEFLRVLRSYGHDGIDGPGRVIAPLTLENETTVNEPDETADGNDG